MKLTFIRKNRNQKSKMELSKISEEKKTFVAIVMVQLVLPLYLLVRLKKTNFSLNFQQIIEKFNVGLEDYEHI